jgi:hypothetical protein
MSEWLDIMLGEIARKQDEEKAAREEAARRHPEDSTGKVRKPADANSDYPHVPADVAPK